MLGCAREYFSIVPTTLEWIMNDLLSYKMIGNCMSCLTCIFVTFDRTTEHSWMLYVIFIILVYFTTPRYCSATINCRGPVLSGQSGDVTPTHEGTSSIWTFLTYRTFSAVSRTNAIFCLVKISSQVHLKCVRWFSLKAFQSNLISLL